MATDTTDETQEQQPQQQREENKPTTPTTDTLTNKFDKMNISLSIWPPTQRTRNAVIDRLIQTLSSPSVLSKRYGSLNPSEAASTARLIEEDAFAIATAAVSSTSSPEPANAEDEVDDGIKILQIYSKEISKRMLEAVKAKAQASSGDGGDDTKESDSVVAEPATSEEISSSTEPEST